MTQLRTSPSGAAVLFPAALAVIAGLLVDRVPAPALINESPSLPRGLYLRDWGAIPQRGSVVALERPEKAKPHLSAWGMPASVLLVKRVAAAEGDLVCAADGLLHTPGRTVTVRDRNGAGLPLPRWSGCRRLGPGEVFLLGDTATSFDSRYFGPLRIEELAGVYIEGVGW